MAEFTMPKHGEICWQELNTQNLSAAKTFYTELLGWNLELSKVSPDTGYIEIHIQGNAMGGMMEINKEWGEDWQKIPSRWVTYIAVDNVDETVEKVKQNSGGICMPPFDAPGIGRMAVVKDPAGVAFSIITLNG
jgi:uncharacterized protein